MQQAKVPTVIIVGAGLGGLTLYHSLIKNKVKKEFNVKIFEREATPQDRWQGFHIGLSGYGIQSLLKCIPTSIASNLTKAMPDPVPGEYHSISITDHTGKELMKPLMKQVEDFKGITPTSNGFILAYRDVLRNVLLEDVPVQWDKKCTGYDETEEGVWVYFEDGSREFCDILVGADGVHSPVRKQKVPELQIYDYGVTFVNADVAAPKHLIDRLLKIHDNCLCQKTLGLNGETTFVALRLIPLENYKDKSEPHYRTSVGFTYLSKFDEGPDSIKVEDDDPASVVEHTKFMIRKLRPKCEYTDIMLELWELVPKRTPSEQENYPFKTYNTIQRRRMQDINPLSGNKWKTSRVTLLGDAAHAMCPVLGLGANNAIQDADKLSQALLNSYTPENYISCIESYENEMLKQRSADVLRSRSAALRQSSPVGYFGILFRNTIMRIINFALNTYYFVNTYIFKR